MLHEVRVVGDSPIIHHSATGLDPTLDINVQINEITKKRGTNRTAVDDLRLKELECQRSLWLDWSNRESPRPAVPPEALRACIEKAARKLKQGPLVREGLQLQSTTFEFDEERYGSSMEEWGRNCQFTTPVVVQRARIMRTRAKFELPWAVVATVYADPDMVDARMLTQWLDIAGQRVGLGDWRPDKSGSCGRFHVEHVKETAAPVAFG